MNAHTATSNPHGHRATDLFSTPLELGLRALFLLALLPKPVDLQRLVIFDYLLVHSADAGGPESLHPATPHRSGEILVKRDLLRLGLRLMTSRDLVAADFSPEGIRYGATDLTQIFVGYFEGGYTNQLLDRARWVVEKFGAMSDQALSQYVSVHLREWGGEFLTEAAVRDVIL
ncbi:MAG TPA: ABC-three component system middle component 2 [Longimicrobium sp.]|jgi:hypothetical protein|uniref:ABC-three component system middle component 2 n=1 Tax=Longimicrobium sp. TaxID=2029185 RepID=UPI002EDAB823